MSIACQAQVHYTHNTSYYNKKVLLPRITGNTIWRKWYTARTCTNAMSAAGCHNVHIPCTQLHNERQGCVSVAKQTVLAVSSLVNYFTMEHLTDLCPQGNSSHVKTLDRKITCPRNLSVFPLQFTFLYFT